ncbi:MAG: HDOD domain-containing protein [Planctomycetales bacterium]|nr:HDOD domain-containing protein [Planctomycetales bacterium]
MIRLRPESLDKTPNHELATVLRSRVSEIGMLPGVATEALEMMRDPECSIREFAHVVQRDVNLAFEVLRLANSSLYGFDTPVASFEEAVFRLGFRQCKNLILASCFSSLMKGARVEEEWIRDVLWQHSYLTAVLGVQLNRWLDLGFQGEEFTSGLLHDFGRMLLAVLMPAEFSSIDSLDFDESVDILLRENDMIGTNHAELAAWYLADNDLPPPLIDAVRWHHDPAGASDYKDLAALTAVADNLANFIQRFDEPEGYDPSSNTAIAILSDAVQRDVAPRFAEVVKPMMVQAIKDANSALHR